MAEPPSPLKPPEAAIGLVGGDIPGHGGDDPGPGIDPADHVVAGVGDVNVAEAVDRHSGRLGQLGVSGPPPVALVAGLAVASEGNEPTVAQDLDHPVVDRVRDEHVAGGVDRDRLGRVQLRSGRLPVRGCGRLLRRCRRCA